MGESRETIDRRSFLWLAGVGASAGMAARASGVAAGTSPALAIRRFSDPAGRPRRPWWVRTVPQPTTEIDWSRVNRFNERTQSVRGPGLANYVGELEAERLYATNQALMRQRIQDGRPGYTLKDYALDAAMDSRPGLSFLGPRQAPTPAERGVPRWSGTPEEAARILRVAMRHMGAAHVAFLELNENTRKLIYSHDPDGKQLVFTDARVASETDDTRIIPKSAKYVIVYLVQMSEETLKRAPTVLASQTASLSYLRGSQIQNSTQEFLRSLGYQALGESSTNALGIAPAFGVLAGLGELSRLNRLVSPEFGPMVRVFKMLTDLPVATDLPIDAGIIEFCKHCKKCAEACPSGALSLEDDPTWDVRGGWNNAGHKAWFEDAVKCLTYWRAEAGSGCGICFAVCPFSKKDRGWVHQWVKASIATAPALDGFFRSMDDAFGYGAQKDCEEWWHLDLPEQGTDSTRPVAED